MEELTNQYQDMLAEKDIQQEVVLKKVQANAKKMKDGLAQMQLGDDSKVDEAIMISFFASLYDDITKAYRAFQEFRLERKAENLEKEKGILQQKIDNIKEFKEQSEMVTRYTVLNIEKGALEKQILELKQVHQKNIAENIVEITDTDQLGDAEKRLLQVVNEMNNIADFYGYDSNTEFMAKLESSEKLWYGDDAAEHIQSLRSLDPSKLESLTENLNSFPGNPEKVTALKNGFEDIQNYVETNGMIFTSDFANKAAGLVTDFRDAALGVQASLTLNELALDGAHIMSEQSEELQTNESPTKERSAQQS